MPGSGIAFSLGRLPLTRAQLSGSRLPGLYLALAESLQSSTVPHGPHIEHKGYTGSVHTPGCLCAQRQSWSLSSLPQALLRRRAHGKGSISAYCLSHKMFNTHNLKEKFVLAAFSVQAWPVQGKKAQVEESYLLHAQSEDWDILGHAHAPPPPTRPLLTAPS